MKTNKKIALAAMALVTAGVAAVGATGTFAWFSINTSVSVTGMVAKTKVNNNLLIDKYDGGSWATNDSTFAASQTIGIESNNVLVPMSSVDGANFYYTDPLNVKGDGDALTDAYTLYSDLATLQTKYPDAEAPYLEYRLVLKAENTSAVASKVNLSKLDLTYTKANAESDAEKAWRVAILFKEFATATVNGAKTDPGLASPTTKIYAPTGAHTFSYSADPAAPEKAVNSTSTLAEVTYASAASDSTLATVAAGQTKYFNVAVRLWLEGEDTTCTVDSFKVLAGSWALDVDFYLEADTTHGVYVINMA